jgi:hypothetical protein
MTRVGVLLYRYRTDKLYGPYPYTTTMNMVDRHSRLTQADKRRLAVANFLPYRDASAHTNTNFRLRLYKVYCAINFDLDYSRSQLAEIH